MDLLWCGGWDSGHLPSLSSVSLGQHSLWVSAGVVLLWTIASPEWSLYTTCCTSHTPTSARRWHKCRTCKSTVAETKRQSWLNEYMMLQWKRRWGNTHLSVCVCRRRSEVGNLWCHRRAGSQAGALTHFTEDAASLIHDSAALTLPLWQIRQNITECWSHFPVP